MEMLSYIGGLVTRKKALIYRAQELISGRKSVEEMEAEMRERNLALVERLRRSKIRFTEFQRVAADETVTAALAGTMFGAKTKQPTETQFADSAKSLPYLWKFFNDIQQALNTGRIESVSDYSEIDDLLYDLAIEDPDRYDALMDTIDEYPEGLLGGDVTGAAIPATWDGVLNRLGRYLVTPIYGFAAAGTMALAMTQGQTMMKRTARLDRKTCQDCIGYAAQGWVPIGLLPPPGQRCACHDNCRCYVEYK